MEASPSKTGKMRRVITVEKAAVLKPQGAAIYKSQTAAPC
jgi:hypothetical protein